MKNIAPLSKNLSEISSTLLSIFNNSKLDKSAAENCMQQLLEIEKPVEDVELIISKDLKKLATFLIEDRKGKGFSKKS